MKKATLALVISVFTAGTLFPGLSQAEGPQHGADPQRHQQQDGRGGDGVAMARHHDSGHGSRERDRFAWKGHDFRRGYPLPPRFHGDDYRINDWRARGLYQPPQGAYWANIDGNYVLIAAATGVITAILLSGALSH